MSLLIVIVTVNVIFRYLEFRSLTLVNELSRFLLIWITLLTAPILIKTDQNLQVEVIYWRLSAKTRYYLRLGQLLTIFLYSPVIIYHGVTYSIDYGFIRDMTTLPYPMFFAYFIIPVFGFLIGLFSLDKFLSVYHNPDEVDEDYQRKYGTSKVKNQTEL